MGVGILKAEYEGAQNVYFFYFHGKFFLLSIYKYWFFCERRYIFFVK